MTDFKKFNLQIKVTESESIRLKNEAVKENRTFSEWARLVLLSYIGDEK